MFGMHVVQLLICEANAITTPPDVHVHLYQWIKAKETFFYW